jgi:hypothetical protein
MCILRVGLNPALFCFMTVISGPVPPFSNLPIEPQYYAPWTFVITNITLGPTTTVTMTIPQITSLNYFIGQLVRLIIPMQFGCRELNGQTGYVIGITPPNQVTLNINSVGINSFQSSIATTKPQITAIGDINTGPTNTGRTNNQTFISGSFINISPN